MGVIRYVGVSQMVSRLHPLEKYTSWPYRQNGLIVKSFEIFSNFYFTGTCTVTVDQLEILLATFNYICCTSSQVAAWHVAHPANSRNFWNILCELCCRWNVNARLLKSVIPKIWRRWSVWTNAATNISHRSINCNTGYSEYLLHGGL